MFFVVQVVLVLTLQVTLMDKTRFKVLVRSRGHFYHFSIVGNGHIFLEQNFMGNKNLQEKIQNYELFSCKMVVFNMRLKKDNKTYVSQQYFIAFQILYILCLNMLSWSHGVMHLGWAVLCWVISPSNQPVPGYISS